MIQCSRGWEGKGRICFEQVYLPGVAPCAATPSWSVARGWQRQNERGRLLGSLKAAGNTCIKGREIHFKLVVATVDSRSILLVLDIYFFNTA